MSQTLRLAPIIGSLLTNPDVSLDYLRHTSLAKLRILSYDELEVYNQFLYEVDPFDREHLLDRLNGNGSRRYKASDIERVAVMKNQVSGRL